MSHSSKGKMSFERFGRLLSVYGGPYKMIPPDQSYDMGVCLLEHEPPAQTWRGMKPCNQLHMPIRDFSVPKVEQVEETLLKIAYAIGRGRKVYIGCMGGRGRTGLFMACLLKAAGVKDDPVGQARLRYSSHAVETKEQEAWVRDWNPSPRWRRKFNFRLAWGVLVGRLFPLPS